MNPLQECNNLSLLCAEEEMKRLQLAIGGDISSAIGVRTVEESGGNYSAMNYSYEGVGDMNLTKPAQSVISAEKKRRRKDQPYAQPLGLYIPHDHDLVLVSSILLKYQNIVLTYHMSEYIVMSIFNLYLVSVLLDF